MFIRINDRILDMNNTNECIYVIRDKSVNESNGFRYVSYLWDNWRDYFLIDYLNCTLFSYNSAQIFISDLMKENLKYQNLVIELSPYYKDCKQSDNLAELCDEFVFYHCIGNPFLYTGSKQRLKEYYLTKKYAKICKENDDFFYGAVWISKGLKYVAKMDDNGELVLL